jgi:hypothetical protein
MKNKKSAIGSSIFAFWEFFDQVKDEDVINLFQQGDQRVIL